MLATFAYTFAMHSRGLTGDTRPAQLLPLAFARNHNLTFDGFAAPPDDYWFTTIDGHVISRYPLVPGLLHLVSYAIATTLGFAFDATNITRLSQITAAILTALSIAPFYLAAGTSCGRGRPPSPARRCSPSEPPPSASPHARCGNTDRPCCF
ncbi:MAG TPA: hypothetical protein VHW00_01670 [Thermoanaerobaculia bacterium]|nr:hypothetical protein [Thermoanaerobaculia bacterium]